MYEYVSGDTSALAFAMMLSFRKTSESCPYTYRRHTPAGMAIDNEYAPKKRRSKSYKMPLPKRGHDQIHLLLSLHP